MTSKLASSRSSRITARESASSSTTRAARSWGGAIGHRACSEPRPVSTASCGRYERVTVSGSSRLLIRARRKTKRQPVDDELLRRRGIEVQHEAVAVFGNDVRGAIAASEEQ